jgi:voltage-gated sodium channel
MAGLCKTISESDQFHRFTLFLILLMAAGMGAGAVPGLAAAYGGMLDNLDFAIQALFVVEIVIRLIAHAPKVHTFFRDRWNTFDFLIVAASLLPAVGAFALIARLLRVLRVLRLLSVSPELRSLIGRLHDAFDEIAGAAVIILVMGYMFVIGGYALFADLDPAHWGDLRSALLSAFYLLLLQDVHAYVEPLAARSLFSLLYFAAFYLAFIGLFISVIVAAVLQGSVKDREKTP